MLARDIRIALNAIHFILSLASFLTFMMETQPSKRTPIPINLISLTVPVHHIDSSPSVLHHLGLSFFFLSPTFQIRRERQSSHPEQLHEMVDTTRHALQYGQTYHFPLVRKQTSHASPLGNVIS